MWARGAGPVGLLDGLDFPSPPAPNPCEANGGRGPCSHLCLIDYNRTVSCACPHLMKLHKDNTTCYGRPPPEPGGHRG